MDYNHICYGCMREYQPGESVCPVCGYRHQKEDWPGHVLRPGTVLHKGKYLVGKVLGEGGFGITYMGFDTALLLKVAIKEYFPKNQVSRSQTATSVIWYGNSDGGAAGKESFLKEARKMAKLDSIPGIVQVREVFSQNNTAYIIMSFIEGETLKARLQRTGAMAEKDCLKLLKPVMEALDQAHHNDMIHLDISPDNLMIDPQGKIWVLDMGAAKDLGGMGSDGHTVFAVKHGFSPPEQNIGEGLGPWTDVYAMCATIYYCLTGKVIPDAMSRLKKDSLSYPSSISPDLAKVLSHGLALDEKARIQSMGALMDELKKIPDHHPFPKWWLIIAAVAILIAGIVAYIRFVHGDNSDDLVQTPTPVVSQTLSPTSTPAAQKIKITKQPSSIATYLGRGAAEDDAQDVPLFTVYAQGAEMQFSWQKYDDKLEDWKDISVDTGNNNTDFGVHITSDQAKGYSEVAAHGVTKEAYGTYRCKITDGSSEEYTDPVLLTERAAPELESSPTPVPTSTPTPTPTSSPAPTPTVTVIKYDDGGMYEGEIKDGKREGQGKMIYADGGVYEGEWKNDRVDGHGIFTYASGDVFEGIWKNDEWNGYGVYTWVSGHIYKGEWVDGKRNGQGIFRWPNGRIYEGEWKDDKINGQGKMTYGEGESFSTYFGEWQDGSLNGQGTMTYANGDVYEGEWKDDKRNGQGKITYANGVYEGEWKDDKRHGQGTYTWANGDVYEGKWQNGEMNGYGTLTWSSDGNSVYKTYSGEWVDSKRDGQGTMVYASGDVYAGEWKEGKKNGRGTMIYADGRIEAGEWKDDTLAQSSSSAVSPTSTPTPTSLPSPTPDVTVVEYENGDVYEGEIEDGNPNGYGMMTYANGDVYKGEWKNGKKEGRGTFAWADGRFYEGNYSNDKVTGIGKFVDVNGNVLEGEWKDDFLSRGFCAWANGDYYEGQWSDGMRNGQGTFKWANGDVLEGQWKDGLINGQCTYKWANGDVFTGTGKDGLLYEGTIIYANGATETGEWKDGVFIKK